MPTGGPGQPGLTQPGLSMNPPTSMAGPQMMPGMVGQPGMPPTPYPGPQVSVVNYPVQLTVVYCRLDRYCKVYWY